MSPGYDAGRQQGRPVALILVPILICVAVVWLVCTFLVIGLMRRAERRHAAEELALADAAVRRLREQAVREPAAVRNAAAAAFYAAALARAAGLPPRAEELAHTAALLADLATTRPGTVSIVPALREVPRLRAVGEVIELAAEPSPGTDAIARAASALAVARRYVTVSQARNHALAVGELWREAGHGLDADLVEVFVGQVLGSQAAWQPDSLEQVAVAFQRDRMMALLLRGR